MSVREEINGLKYLLSLEIVRNSESISLAIKERIDSLRDEIKKSKNKM